MKFSFAAHFHTPSLLSSLVFISAWAGLGFLGGKPISWQMFGIVGCVGLAVGAISCWAYRGAAVSSGETPFSGWLTKEVLGQSWQGRVLAFNEEIRLFISVALSLVPVMPDFFQSWACVGVAFHLCMLLLIVLPDRYWRWSMQRAGAGQPAE